MTTMQNPTWLPLFWNLEGRRVVIVGGGEAAAGKAPLVVEAGARVEIISPELSESLRDLVDRGTVDWIERRFEPGDVRGATFAIAATDDPDANQEVYEEAERLGIPVNAVDDPERCSVIFSAVHRDGPLVVAVSTSGAAPALAVRLRDRIADMTQGYGRRLTMLRTYRDQIRTRFPSFGQRRDVWYRIVDTLDDPDTSADQEEAVVVQHVIDDHVGRIQVASPTTSGSSERRIAAALEHSVAPILTCSMQLGGLVLVDQVRRFMPDIPVVFVDTGYHFPETLAFRDRVAEEWDLNLRIVAAEPAVDVHEQEHGVLHRADPARCCAVRKVGPAEEALYGHDLWFAAVRRTQGGSRVNLPVELDHQTPQGYMIRKVHPLVDWTWTDIERYAARHDVPRHPLYDEGFTSIGCAPCTTPTFGIGGERAGRWDGTEITECGLHVSADGGASA